jgi:hypothetical protein
MLNRTPRFSVAGKQKELKEISNTGRGNDHPLSILQMQFLLLVYIIAKFNSVILHKPQLLNIFNASSEYLRNKKNYRMAWSTFYVRYIIVYADGQRSESGTNLNLEGPSESAAIDTLKRQNNVPQNAQIIIKSFEKVG